MLLEKQHHEISMSRHTRLAEVLTLPKPLSLFISSSLKERSISQEVIGDKIMKHLVNYKVVGD